LISVEKVAETEEDDAEEGSEISTEDNTEEPAD